MGRPFRDTFFGSDYLEMQSKSSTQPQPERVTVVAARTVVDVPAVGAEALFTPNPSGYNVGGGTPEIPLPNNNTTRRFVVFAFLDFGRVQQATNRLPLQSDQNEADANDMPPLEQIE